MTNQAVPGLGNVVRFPVEKRVRPSLDLLREVAPDIHVVELAAVTFGLALPKADFRYYVDVRTAEYILNKNVCGWALDIRDRILNSLLDPVVFEAIAAARAWRHAACLAELARQHLIEANAEGGCRPAALEQQCEALEQRAAELSVEAHFRSERAEGVARPVDLARSGEDWTPPELPHET